MDVRHPPGERRRPGGATRQGSRFQNLSNVPDSMRERVRARDRLLISAAVLTGLASLLHLGIILGGPDWYRFFGAGEEMARLAAAGSAYPTVVTSGIALVLAVWALYGASGAGMIRRLPLLRLALALIAAVYLARGILGVPYVLFVESPYANELEARMTFMLVSSALCVYLGACYAAGAVSARKETFAPDA